MIDDELLQQAQTLTGPKTKGAIVDGALKLSVHTEKRKRLLNYYGMWKDDLHAMKRNRV